MTNWVLAAILVITCGVSVLTSCSNDDDTERQFSLTGKPNPYVITLSRNGQKIK